jgi:hypothetical protein
MMTHLNIPFVPPPLFNKASHDNGNVRLLSSSADPPGGIRAPNWKFGVAFGVMAFQQSNSISQRQAHFPYRSLG